MNEDFPKEWRRDHLYALAAAYVRMGVQETADRRVVSDTPETLATDATRFAIAVEAEIEKHLKETPPW